MSWVEVYSCATRTEAELVVQKLKSYGIESLIKADDEGGFHPGMAMVTGVRVFVPSDELERANDLLLPMDQTRKSQI